GQPLPIDVYNLVCEEGIESRIAGLVGSKQAFFKGLFDGDSDAIQFEQSSSFLSKVREIYADEIPTVGKSDGEEIGLETVLAVEDEADEPIDDGADDPFDSVIEAGDESQDRAEPPADVPPGPTFAPSGGAATPSLPEIRHLFTQLRVRRSESGGVTIEAPPEAASTLGALFEGMAALLQAAADPDRPA
ncbi:MAG: hypothetical protein AB7I30_08285, partial [Isosphaeraceae bacterium]